MTTQWRYGELVICSYSPELRNHAKTALMASSTEMCVISTWSAERDTEDIQNEYAAMDAIGSQGWIIERPIFSQVEFPIRSWVSEKLSPTEDSGMRFSSYATYRMRQLVD